MLAAIVVLHKGTALRLLGAGLLAGSSFKVRPAYLIVLAVVLWRRSLGFVVRGRFTRRHGCGTGCGTGCAQGYLHFWTRRVGDTPIREHKCPPLLVEPQVYATSHRRNQFMIAMEIGQIHPTALIDEGAHVGSNVTIGAYAIVHAGVELGDDSVVGPHCILGEPSGDFYREEDYENPPLRIGSHALIRSHSVLYSGSSIGEHFQSGHRVTIREKSKLGRHVRVGTVSDIQGDCTIGDYVSLHSNVHVGQKSQLGNFVWIFPYSVLTNDPQPPSGALRGVTIEEFAVIATMVVILPGVHVGHDALIGASSLVRMDVIAESVVVGNPARQVATIHDLKNKETGLGTYPWRDHFDRGMPWEQIGYASWAMNRTEGTLHDSHG